jgi:hypothetical protein
VFGFALCNNADERVVADMSQAQPNGERFGPGEEITCISASTTLVASTATA